MTSRSLTRLLLLTVLLGVPQVAAHAQTQNTVSVSGIVVDSMGGAIVGATVTARTVSGERRATTDSRGAFAIDGIPVGPVTVVVAFDQFAPATTSVQAPARDLRIALQPDAVTEQVTVRAPATTSLRVTTATKTDTSLLDVPQAVSVVTRDLIHAQSMRSMADVVNYVPGVGMAQGEGHRDAPIFRGNTSTSDFFVDGVRDDTQYLRDLYNVERVEVLKGPNGMVFGRGGVGGVINRVTRQAEWMPIREVVLQGGSWNQRRLSADLGQAFSVGSAARLTGVYENSETYRAGNGLERYGINPTVAFRVAPRTIVRAGYEFFRDERTVDRGFPSFQGRPLDADPSTFFGNSEVNESRLTVNSVAASVDHRLNNSLTLRNQVRFADYDKYYQNTVPGAVNAARTTFALTAYSSGTDRQNLFNQTDLTFSGATRGVQHTVVAGLEVGRQVTDNLRLTGFFPSAGATATSVTLSLADPATSLPVEFHSSAREQDNHGNATVAGMYVQDQVTLTRYLQAVAGLRYDRFDVNFTDNRTGAVFASTDNLVSPRVGVIVKPVTAVSFYASYSRSYLPRAGEQLSSLNLTNQALDPEVFRNVEVGAKWELGSAVSLTGAVYRLTHGNVVVRDAVNPTLSHLVDAERTTGLELELAGSLSDRWSVHGGYAYQDGEITRSLSASVPAGARLAQVPRHSLSLWNRYDVTSRIGLGLGVLSKSDRFVATDNLVVLPSFARVDAALFATITRRLRAHINVENLFDEHYFWAAHNNNNIAPGSPRAVRASLITQF